MQAKHNLHQEEYKLALANNGVCLYEALIRWIHPEKGVIPALSFLPVIGNFLLEIEGEHWVINTAINQAEL
jgi:EAL domain-containing protein (putative c-di-GMP-specific phosphodiesterase class I)